MRCVFSFYIVLKAYTGYGFLFYVVLEAYTGYVLLFYAVLVLVIGYVRLSDIVFRKNTPCVFSSTSRFVRDKDSFYLMDMQVYFDFPLCIFQKKNVKYMKG